MTISKLEKLFNINSSLDIGRCKKKKISEVIANLPQGQKERIQLLWNDFLANRENSQKFKELKKAILSLRPVQKFDSNTAIVISGFVGNPVLACVSKNFRQGMKKSDEITLKTYLADPKIAPYVPKTNESATVRVRKTIETIKALATPILDELPREIQQLSPLDLRPRIEAIEDRDLIQIFKKLKEQIPGAPLLNLDNPKDNKANATVLRDWLDAPINQPLFHPITNLPLSNLKLTVLPPQIERLASLQQLDLRNNRLQILPPQIGQLAALQRLAINNNQLKTLPPEIGQLASLEGLGLDDNQLEVLPPEIGRLVALRRLGLNNNQLEALPSEFRQLTSLQQLAVGNNQLKTVPPEITQLTSLQELGLDNNQLEVLPSEIGQLTALQRLDLENNQLKTLPPEIGRLAALRWLHLSNNQLKTLPPEIDGLQLLGIKLDGNPIAFSLKFKRDIIYRSTMISKIVIVATLILLVIGIGGRLYSDYINRSSH